jgi:RNA polymerase primary sigma factor
MAGFQKKLSDSPLPRRYEDADTDTVKAEDTQAMGGRENVETGETHKSDFHHNDRSSLQLYLQEIGRVALLTPEQEVELAGRIKLGDARAREHMIQANLRLVVKIAYDYSHLGLPLLDLISEGNIGLMKAVERFDPAKGGKLSTYAAWWIKQSIKRALANQSKTIRLPVHMVDKVARLRKTAMQLQESLGREPTNEELAEAMGLPVRKIAHLKTVSVRPSSLDAPVGDDDKTELGELVCDENEPTPFENLRGKTTSQDIGLLVANLEPREAEILRLRFGLDGELPKTLEEVGLALHVTRERVRQLQNTALAKLRKSLVKLEKQNTAEEAKDEMAPPARPDDQAALHAFMRAQRETGS